MARGDGPGAGRRTYVAAAGATCLVRIRVGVRVGVRVRIGVRVSVRVRVRVRVAPHASQVC